MPHFVEASIPIGKRLWREVKEDDIPGLAAELAFRFFMSLFPLVLVLVTLGAFISGWAGVDDPSGEVLDAVGDSLPPDARSVLSNQIEDVISGKSLGLLSIGLATALWSAAGGAGALMKAINRVYDLPETRRWPVKTGVALGITLLGGLGLLLAVTGMILTQTFADSIASGLGFSDEFGWLVQLLRLPLIILFVAMAAETVYWIAPNRWTKPRLASPGAWFFAVCWAAFTAGFAFYVSNFGSYNATYGAIAGVVILLFWFNASALLILVGAELNAVLEARAEEALEAVFGPAFEPVAPFAGPPRERASFGLEWAFLLGAAIAFAAWLRRPAASARDD